MNELDRIRKLAGILKESIQSIPSVGGNKESDMQTTDEIGIGDDDASFDAAQPALTEKEFSDWQITAINDRFRKEMSQTSFLDKAIQNTIDGLFAGGVVNSSEIKSLRDYLENSNQLISEWDEDPGELRSQHQEGLESSIEFYLNQLGVDVDEGNLYQVAKQIESMSRNEFGIVTISQDDVIAYLDRNIDQQADDHLIPDVGNEFDAKLGENDELSEKSRSEKQARFMAAAAHDKEFARSAGIDQSVAKEFNRADTGTRQLSRAMKKEDIGMESYSMNENDEYNIGFIRQAIAHLYPIARNEEELKSMVAGETGYGSSENFDTLFSAALDDFLGRVETEFGDADDMLDVDADADALSSAGWGSDEDYGGPDDFYLEEGSKYDVEFNGRLVSGRSIEIDGVDTRDYPDFADAYISYAEYEDGTPLTDLELEAFQDQNRDLVNELAHGSLYEDLNNGYHSTKNLDGKDYFPTGADGPVVKSVGPSGAKHGDNPEQKRMKVDEVHRELVYNYRNFLKENSGQKKKLTEDAVNFQVQNDQYSANTDGRTAWLKGTFDMTADVDLVNGTRTTVAYSLAIEARASVDVETDETPTGWNYRTDSPTYTTDRYLTLSGDTQIKLSMDPKGLFMIDDANEISLDQFVKSVSPNSLAQLTNPQNYKRIVDEALGRVVENYEPQDDWYDEESISDRDERF